MGRHFAFVCDPAAGHINPTLPLVEELTRRGHRVSYATASKFQHVVEAAGATAVVLPGDEPPLPASPKVTADDLATMLEQVLRDARTSLPIIESHFDQDPPDAVCFDMMSFPGRLLAEKKHWPGIALLPTYAANEQFCLTALFVSDTFDPSNPRLLELDRQMVQFGAEHGVDINPNPMAAPLAPLNIVFIPKQFQLAAETFDERFRFVGPSVRLSEDTSSWQPPSDGGPIVFVSLGTGFNNHPEFFRTCIEAFAGSHWHVVMAIGNKVALADIGEPPPNFDIRPFVPQQAVLRYASVFISHVGMGSTMDALYFGVPVVAMPEMPEMRVNAQQIEDLALGVQLDHAGLTAGRLAAAVARVNEDQRIRASMAEMSRVTRAAGGAVAAADAIEKHLTEQ